MGVLKDGWENIKRELVSTWAGLSPENRVFLSGVWTGMGVVIIVVVVLAWLVS